MHASGHDAHTAILLSVAHIVAEMFNRGGEVNGTVKFLFQPAKEAAESEQAHHLMFGRFVEVFGAYTT